MFNHDWKSEGEIKTEAIRECERLKKLVEHLSIKRYRKFKRQMDVMQSKCQRIVRLSDGWRELFRKNQAEAKKKKLQALVDEGIYFNRASYDDKRLIITNGTVVEDIGISF